MMVTACSSTDLTAFVHIKYGDFHKANDKSYNKCNYTINTTNTCTKGGIHFSTGKDSLLDFSCLEDQQPKATAKNVPDVAQLHLQLQQTQQLSDWYREQCIKAEEELSRVKEESKTNIIKLMLTNVVNQITYNSIIESTRVI